MAAARAKADALLAADTDKPTADQRALPVVRTHLACAGVRLGLLLNAALR